MEEITPGTMAIVDFTLGGTETRTVTTGGGGGGSLFMGTGFLNGTWVKSQAIQRNTIPKPEGSIREMTVDAADIEVLAGSRMSAACFMGNKGRWHWIAVKNHETGEVLQRTFGNKTAQSIDMVSPHDMLKTLATIGALIVVGYAALLSVQYVIEPGLGAILFIGIPFVALILGFVISARFKRSLPVNKIKRYGKTMLKDHSWEDSENPSG